jgi:hypothetical protein
MNDVTILVVTVGFGMLTWLLIVLSDRLLGRDRDDRN